ncbi:hypothetical protein ACIPPJ_32665 [Streptomyces sp. NPDC086091]|uniref:hypothetical protein n=1 Tax=Streptomyces sp. NPDC086091 TaxID=3365751 RepID=UPI00382F1ABF
MTTYDETTTAALLDAGAVLPPGTTDREDADVLTVRTYTHPGLDDRTIVRLVPGTLGEAEDLALDFLGLVRAEETPEVGQVRRETLGFPAWALVHDPANGHHALALVKDVERLARQAKSRPGNAKEGFEALGDRLGRAVPHFLPTFYEQAARVFLQFENTTYAAAFFGKARDAERVHALAVDEERQRAVFLEFAFAGALTVKALKEHVRALAARLSPAEAWQQFRQLTVERCAAGMPPYASLPQDARGLVKAAGLDRAAEEGALVADLIASPASVRAPASFWNAYRETLAALAAERPSVRARLLEIMPAGLGRTVEDDEYWLGLLTECGADLLLTGETAAPADGPEVDPADWLTRWALHRKHGASVSDRSPATLDLVTRMAPRLRELGRPVGLFSGRWHPGADLDLLDLCAAEGVPLTPPAADDEVYLPLEQWLKDEREGRRDLAGIGAVPSLRHLLYQAVGRLRGDNLSPALQEGLTGQPVLAEVLRDWLDHSADALLAATGLPGARAALDRMRPFRRIAARVAPAALAKVAAYETAPLLGRTLRAGLFDELGWPALETALKRLDAEKREDRDDSLGVDEAWPALILSRRGKVIVVGPQDILLEHDLRLPADLEHWQRPSFRYTDGELLVMWRRDGKQHGYWSARPSEPFVLGGEQIGHWYSGGDVDEPSIPLAGGGRATGGRTLHAGDTVLPPNRAVLGDGTSFWRQGRQGRDRVWLEYDPATGTHGRASLPAFLAGAVREDTKLLQQHCVVLPLQPGLADSPFGTDGAVLGRWVRAEGEGDEARTVAGTPDGRTVSVPAGPDGRVRGLPLGALRLPGGAAPVAAVRSNEIALYTPDDSGAAGELGRVKPLERGGEFASGTRLVPPADFWHALRPRDEASSAVLRALTDEHADDLLRAGRQALTAYAEAVAAHKAAAKRAEEAAADPAKVVQVPSPDADHFVRPAVAGVLPGLTEPHLLKGVVRLVRAVLAFAVSTADLLAPPVERPRQENRRVHGMFADYRPEHGDDRTLREATQGLTDQQGWWGGEQWNALRQIRAVNHVLSGKPADGKALPRRAGMAGTADGWASDEFTVPGIGIAWPSVLDALRPLAYRAASPMITDAHREALLLLLEAVQDGPLAATADGALREAVLAETYEKENRQERVGQVLRRDGRTVVVLGCQSVDRDEKRVRWLVLDHDPAGVFGAVAHFTLDKEKPHPPVFPADRLAAVTRLVREKGAAPWQPEAPQTLAPLTGDGLGPVQATLLIAGRPSELPTATLAEIGLKPRQRDFGQGLLQSLADEDVRALVGALLPDTPGDLWTSGPDAAAAGRVWTERLSGFVRVPEDIAADLELTGLSASAVESVLNPARTPWMSRTTRMHLDKDGDLVPVDGSAVPGRYQLAHSVDALTALGYLLPYGHPWRALLPEGLAALRRRLSDPELLLDLGVSWGEKGTIAPELRKAYGLEPAGGADARGLTPLGDALVLRPWYQDKEYVLIRPAGLTGPDDPALGLVEGLVAGARDHGLRTLRTVLGDDLARALRAGNGPETPEGHAQDPTVVVPELVTEAATALGVGEDAATLYLQLLALPDPTDRNIARWTGWKPARLKKARAELAATDLVVEAKRPRAGRTLFLPCGWLDLKAPALPVELWKRGLYPVGSYTRAVPPLPVPELFARAWERVRSGDAPAYEELTTRATRKGRRR